MTEVTPDVQALIDEALERQRQELLTPKPSPINDLVMPKPQDHLPKAKRDPFEAQIEALKAHTVVEFRGVAFNVRPPDEWLLDFDDLQQSQRVSAIRDALTLAIGEEQYATFAAMDPKPGLVDHMAIVRRIQEAINAGDS